MPWRLPSGGCPISNRVLRAGGASGIPAGASDGAPAHPGLRHQGDPGAVGEVHVGGGVEHHEVGTAAGDQGARAYLAAHDVTLVECGDLATGRDVDR